MKGKKYLKIYLRVAILFILWNSVHHCVCAHEGHDHWGEAPVSIKKSTYDHLRTIISAYKTSYAHMVKKELHETITLSQKIITASGHGLDIEKKGEGRYMLEHIHLAAKDLQKAGSIKEAQMAFAAMSNALFPFFASWPNQLKNHGLKLYRCNEEGYYWLQPRDEFPACPYTDEISLCFEIEEIENR